MPLRRRSLHPGSGDCHDSSEPGCSSPPSPPPPILHPTPSPSPSPSPGSPPIARLAPSPSPVHGGAGGRRDQGTHGYNPAGGGADGHHRLLITVIVATAAALAFLSLILLGVSVAVRRRRLRRQALLATAPAAAANVEDGGNDDPEGGGGVVHHVWYIRTIGLDEAAINSIAMIRYRAGAGLLGSADCSVCLGEFQDGELVRLLPKCGHAFHVPCVDTWLRAHVNCPLCRSEVLDPAAAAAGGGSESNANQPADPDANTNAAAEQAAATSDSILEHEEEENDREAPHVEEDLHEQLSSPEPLPQQIPCSLPRNVRRAASMDAAIVSAAADVAALDRLPEAAPEEEQSGRRKHQTGAKVSGSGHQSDLSTERPASGGAPRSFFSRHCRARSSVLPL